MWRRWVNGGGLLCLLALVGCRQTTPNIKPPKEPERLTAPPMESRFSVPGLPKAAFQDRDTRKLNDDGVMPARGPGFGRPGMPGSP